jgi:hypothetical protein
MKWESREQIINRICSGRIQLDVGLFTLPSIKTKFEADYQYELSYKEALKDGMMNDDDKIIELYRRGIWSDLLEEELVRLKKGIDSLKYQLYDNRMRPTRLEQFRQQIQQDRERILELESIRGTFDSMTASGYAAAVKIEYIISKTVRPFKDDAMEDYLLNYYKIYTPERQLRYISRHEPWRTMYLSLKTRAISVKPSRWGIDQRGLILWSKMYDNINNYEKKPESWVVEDDDMLDGWMLYINKEKKREERDSGRPAKQGFNETFIFIDEDDDGKAVDEMNSPLERAMKRRKLAEVPRDRAVNVTSMSTAQEQMMMVKGM